MPPVCFKVAHWESTSFNTPKIRKRVTLYSGNLWQFRYIRFFWGKNFVHQIGVYHGDFTFYVLKSAGSTMHHYKKD